MHSESVALAFRDDVRGWPSAQDALHAFCDTQIVTADGVRGPDGVPTGEPALQDESEDETTWVFTSGGEERGSATAVRLGTGWIIQYYSRAEPSEPGA